MPTAAVVPQGAPPQDRVAQLSAAAHQVSGAVMASHAHIADGAEAERIYGRGDQGRRRGEMRSACSRGIFRCLRQARLAGPLGSWHALSGMTGAACRDCLAAAEGSADGGASRVAERSPGLERGAVVAQPSARPGP